MSIRPETARGELIDRVLAAGPGAPADSGDPADLAAFLRQYFEWVDGDDLAERRPDDLHGAAVCHWRLAQHRTATESRIAVYRPQIEDHGWVSPHTVVDIVTEDMPFLVDSVTMELSRHRLGIHLIVHPVIAVTRDADGELTAVGEQRKWARPESFIHVEVDAIGDPAVLGGLEADLRRVLDDVRRAVGDWRRMVRRAVALADELEDRAAAGAGDAERLEAAALLRWMADDHFTFIGYQRYDLLTVGGADTLRSSPDTALGILRADRPEPSLTALSTHASAVARAGPVLVLTKANARSTVHRPAPLDYVGVTRFDEAGRVVGEDRFLGLFTNDAVRASCFDIPVVRRKAEGVLRRAALDRSSHAGKSLVAILETYPRDELFQASEDELLEASTGILAIEERHLVRVFIRRDVYRRYFSCVVFVPRDRYTTTTRHRIETVLAEMLGGTTSGTDAYLSESVLARLHIIVKTEPDGDPGIDRREIEARLADVTRTWTEGLSEALVEEFGEAEGLALLLRYEDAFPPTYRDDTSGPAAVADIRKMEQLDAPGAISITLHQPLEAPEGALRLRVLRQGPEISLSEIMPMLENMGVTVIDEHPYDVRAPGRDRVWIYDFGLQVGSAEALSRDKYRVAFQDALAQVWRGAVENDGFNRLGLLAGLTWRDVVILRAASKYLRQAGSTFSPGYMEATLAGHPDVARQLVELFEARLDPARQGAADSETRRLVAAIESALDAVDSLDEDRILRSFLRVIGAILRTNFYQAGPPDYLSFKLDPSQIPELPLPRPAFEIFVYSPRTEGIHLRGGKVARGGIRWSDRREDFRTEILGLMKAQTVKNVVIVPVGAKGGFVVKRPPSGGDRAALMAEVVACYQTLIHGLLDLTDNLVDGRIVAPADTVRHDGDDHYLVVAADKGTATFSDIANAISLERGYWLGDAFASGGSSGYDHKRMGITARGAWESVCAHFATLGVDPQSTDFTVVGIGDMSGDVFGNGMLLSRHIRLVAAFDHRHVFLDPDPDPERSIDERARLFALPQSSWADYDRSLISAGGGVYPRTAKSVPLSPQVRALLGVDVEELTPQELIRALLCAPVDLLWNGGIGTYVKATSEGNDAAGDRANDAVRVNGAQLRCRVVGEGGNLGLTQPARVEYALAGGLVNTDAIDNSAGVDCSDHEVNIKILLDAVVGTGVMTIEQRNALLEEMTDEVARLVLRDNVDQNRALANANAQAAAMVDVHSRYIRALAAEGRLDRDVEHMPSDAQLAERVAAGVGLTSPEFAVLLAYTKITAYEALLESDAPEDPFLERALVDYFPSALRDRFADAILHHPLRREIIATGIANAFVNRAGTSLVFRLSQETGADTAAVVRAHTAAREMFAVDRIDAGIGTCTANVTATTAVHLRLETRKLVERAARWLLRHRRPPLDIAATVRYFEAGLGVLAGMLPDLVQGDDRTSVDQAVDAYRRAGVPADVARAVACLNDVYSGLDIVEIATAQGARVGDVAAVYFVLGARLRFDWLRDRIIGLPRAARWEALAREALRDDLYREHAAVVADAFRTDTGGDDLRSRVDGWLERNEAAAQRFMSVIADIEGSGASDVTTLSVALRELRDLVPERQLSP
jgi:glutamate dehydrogenase